MGNYRVKKLHEQIAQCEVALESELQPDEATKKLLERRLIGLRSELAELEDRQARNRAAGLG